MAITWEVTIKPVKVAEQETEAINIRRPARNNVQIACDALELSAKTNLEGRS
jgi:hypothetical protein